MFGSVGGPEIVLIFIVALIVFGPKQLPEIGRKVGGLMREFRKASGEFRVNMEREIGFDPMTGLEVTKKARRDLLSSVSEPIREVAQGTIGAVREAGEEASSALRVARTLGPGSGAAQSSVPATEADRPAGSPTPRDSYPVDPRQSGLPQGDPPPDNPPPTRPPPNEPPIIDPPKIVPPQKEPPKIDPPRRDPPKPDPPASDGSPNG